MRTFSSYDKDELFLIPGMSCNGVLWEDQVQNLSDQVRVRVPVLDDCCSMEQMAERVLAAAPPRFMIAGMSMGGYVCLEIMRRAPERVRALGLFNTSARPESLVQTERRMDCIETIRRGQFELLIRHILPRFVHPSRYQDHAFRERVLHMVLDVGAAAFVRQQFAMIGRADSRPLLSQIACPTLVIAGADDHLTTLEEHEEMANAIPNARLMVVNRSAHMTAIEQPEQVTAAMRAWLAALDRPVPLAA